jgi:hypothetical protein
MYRSPRRKLVTTSLAALVAVLALACGVAQAQTKPFKISGAGVGPFGLPLPGEEPREHWIVGEATFLGRHFGEGTVQTDTAQFDPLTGQITGEFGSGSPFVFTAANGDELVCWYGRTDHGASEPGTFDLTIVGILEDGSLLVMAQWIAEFVPDPDESTGRFEGVTGGWVMYAWTTQPFVLGSDDPVYYAWQGQGTLTFPK